MAREPLDRKRICEVLESCRAGSNDLSDPAFADVAERLATNPEWERLYEQIQDADQKISVLFHDVEIPSGLEQRLTAALRLALVEDAISLALSGNEEEAFTDPITSTTAKRERIVTRRWFLMAGGLLTAAAAIFLAIFLKMNNTAEYSEGTVLEEAVRFFDADLPSGKGRLVADNPPPGNFPMSKAIRPFKGIRWRNVTFMGQTGVAFDLPAVGGTRATLYAFYRKIDNLDSSPKLKPYTTGGRSSAAWEENGLVYVLVVQGDQNSYQEYLNVQRGQMA